MEETRMAMSTNLHINTGKANMQVYELSECKANVMQIEDETFNQVAVFMTLEQMEELANKLLAYVAMKGEN